MINAIVTMPPYAPFMDEVLSHERTAGIRLNTVMPVKESLYDLIKRLSEKTKSFGKELWIDLKCRQLRIKNYGVPPFTEIELSHKIEVNLPTKAYFSDRKESATILEIVDGNKLIMLEGPQRVVGPGESVSIPDSSLKIEGYLTDTDKKYIEACKKNDVHNYMLSFLESKEDVNIVKSLDEKANIIAKIESIKGMNYVRHEFDKSINLMAARGDLFIELKWPHEITRAVEYIVKKDENAIVASRLLSSLSLNLEPSCEDINDIDNLLRMEYKRFMFGDDVCLKRDSIISALNLFNYLAKSYDKK